MISAVVLTKNEEKNIAKCLQTLKWCDETIVIDDNSTDQTVKIAKDLGARVFVRPLNNDFATQRNFALTKATEEWVLFVDADERVTPSLAQEICTEVARENHPRGVQAFAIKRVDQMWGRKLKYGETGNVELLRLAKKEVGKWKRQVHETWDVKGGVSLLKNPLLHYPHPTIQEFLSDIDRYSTLHAQANYEEGKRSNLLKIILWPKLKFIQNYIFRNGFLDGPQGFMVAMLMSFHSYLAWGKLWLLQRKINDLMS